MDFDFIQDITDFIFIESQPEKSDVIFIPGSSTPELAERAAELYAEGMASCVLPSGKYAVELGHFKQVKSKPEEYPGPYETECAFYCDVLRRHGVPEQAILREDESTYTYQNAMFSRRVTDAAELTVNRAILVCKAFHARRAYTYYKRAFPDADIYVIPVVSAGISRDTWYKTENGIRRVLGELQRLGTQFEDYVRAVGMEMSAPSPDAAANK